MKQPIEWSDDKEAFLRFRRISEAAACTSGKSEEFLRHIFFAYCLYSVSDTLSEFLTRVAIGDIMISPSTYSRTVTIHSRHAYDQFGLRFSTTTENPDVHEIKHKTRQRTRRKT